MEPILERLDERAATRPDRRRASILKGLGLLERGHLVETDRAGLVAGYMGQTAENVDEIVKSDLEA